MTTLFDLPLDVLELIALDDPFTIVPLLSQCSKYLYQRLRSIYIRVLSSSDISVDEIETYLRKHPSTFGLYMNRSNDVSVHRFHQSYGYLWYQIGTSVYTRGDSYSYMPREDQEYRFNDFNHYAMGTNHVIEIISSLPDTDTTDVWKVNQIDLLSQYRIFSQRLGCFNEDPDYAKNRVLENFDSCYDHYTTTGYHNICYILLFHMWISLQTYTLNIVPAPSQFNIYDHKKDLGENELDTMTKENLMYAEKVRMNLLHLVSV